MPIAAVSVSLKGFSREDTSLNCNMPICMYAFVAIQSRQRTL